MPKVDRESRPLDTANTVRQGSGTGAVGLPGQPVQKTSTSSQRVDSYDGPRSTDTEERKSKREINDLDTWKTEFAKVDIVDQQRDADFEAQSAKFERSFEDRNEELARERRTAEEKKKQVRRTQLPKSRIPVITLSPLHHVVVPPVGHAGPNLPPPNLPSTSPMLYPLWSGESVEELQTRAQAYERTVTEDMMRAAGYGKTVEDLTREEEKRRLLREDQRRLLRREEERRLENKDSGFSNDGMERAKQDDRSVEYIREQELLHEQLLEEQREREMTSDRLTQDRMLEEQIARDTADRQRQAERLAEDQRERDRRRYDD